MRFAKASQGEHAFDWPARPDRHHAAFWWLVGALNPHIPDGLSAGDAAGIIGDLSPASARLILSKDEAVAARSLLDADGRARLPETLTEFPRKLLSRQQQGRHRLKPAAPRAGSLPPVLALYRGWRRGGA